MYNILTLSPLAVGNFKVTLPPQSSLIDWMNLFPRFTITLRTLMFPNTMSFVTISP